MGQRVKRGVEKERELEDRAGSRSLAVEISYGVALGAHADAVLDVPGDVELDGVEPGTGRGVECNSEPDSYRRS